MKRIILNTNIYGRILEDEEPEKFRNIIVRSGFSVYGLDIIVSTDRKTMICDEAVKAYKIINNINKMEFRRLIL